MKIPGVALANLKKNLTRTWLLFAIIAIVSCTLFAATLFLKSINNALRIGTYRLGADIVVVPAEAEAKAEAALLSGEPAQFLMDKSKLDEVKKVEGVANAAPQLFIKKESNLSCCYVMNVFLVAFDPGSDFTVKPWIDKNLGRKLGSNEVVTGRSVPVAPGNTMPFFGSRFTVGGTMEATGMNFFDRAVFMNLETAYNMADDSRSKAVLPLGIRRDQISAVLVRTNNEIDPERVAIRIEHDVSGVRALASDAIVSTVRKQLAVLMNAVSIMSNILWLVLLLIMAFAYHTIAKERCDETGLLPIPGVTRNQIAAIFLHEAALLSAAGGLAGILLGCGLLISFKDLMLHYLRLPYLFPSTRELLTLAVSALLISVMTGLFASVLPVLRILKTAPYEPIRSSAVGAKA
jgi:putative ABC transport system permease protein